MVIGIAEMTIDKESLLQNGVINIIDKTHIKIAFDYTNDGQSDKVYIIIMNISPVKVHDLLKCPAASVSIGGIDAISRLPFNVIVRVSINKTLTISGQVNNAPVSIKFTETDAANTVAWRQLISLFIQQNKKNL